MRVTNNMIMRNASSNINGTKNCVNDRNTQMTTQKKINKPSDDPVIAIRSLRLSTTLSKVNQYYKKNIPDAESWLDVTETALLNIKNLMTDARTLAVNGSTDTLTQTDRDTILTQLEKLQEAMFAEGNADYAGRTVFTGYRTDRELIFSAEDNKEEYSITQEFSASDLTAHRYYYGSVEIPESPEKAIEQNTAYQYDKNAYLEGNGEYIDPEDATGTSVIALTDAPQISETYQAEYSRIRLGYNNVDYREIDGDADVFSKADFENLIKFSNSEVTDMIGSFKVYENSEDPSWAEDCYNNGQEPLTVGDNEVVFLKKTGEFIFGKDISDKIKSTNCKIRVDYEKNGFEENDLRPEYYYNCTRHEVDKNVDYTKFITDGGEDRSGFIVEELQFDIEYTVSANQTITVNTEASDVFNSDIQRDITEMIACVKKSIAAHEKIDKIKVMKTETQYEGTEAQEALDAYLAAAQKEADYADNDMQKLFSSELGAIDGYLAKITLGITNLGCVTDSLALTEKRMNDQQETVQELQSKNDDIELSQIIIEYTAAYTAYQSSLTAAGKLGQQSLLNYI